MSNCGSGKTSGCKVTKFIICSLHCLSPLLAMVFFFYFLTKAPELSFPAALVVSSFIISSSFARSKSYKNCSGKGDCKKDCDSSSCEK
jgi:hypothetical protein